MEVHLVAPVVLQNKLSFMVFVTTFEPCMCQLYEHFPSLYSCSFFHRAYIWDGVHISRSYFYLEPTELISRVFETHMICIKNILYLYLVITSKSIIFRVDWTCIKKKLSGVISRTNCPYIKKILM